MSQTQEENNKEKIELQCRKLLLDSYSSQLNTHSRLIIGFALILLSLLEVKRSLPTPISGMQFVIVYFGISLVAFGLWFLLMRHLTYGVLTSAATNAEPKGDCVNTYWRILEGVVQYTAKKKILVWIPTKLFFSTGMHAKLDRSKGLVLCTILALITVGLTWILMG